MKIKLLLISATLLGVAYLVGCGSSGNNNNAGSCAPGQVWNGSTCIVSTYGAGAAQCASLPPGTPQYSQCMAQYGGGCATPYAGGVQPYNYPGQYGYNGGQCGPGAYGPGYSASGYYNYPMNGMPYPPGYYPVPYNPNQGYLYFNMNL